MPSRGFIFFFFHDFLRQLRLIFTAKMPFRHFDVATIISPLSPLLMPLLILMLRHTLIDGADVLLRYALLIMLFDIAMLLRAACCFLAYTRFMRRAHAARDGFT